MRKTNTLLIVSLFTVMIFCKIPPRAYAQEDLEKKIKNLESQIMSDSKNKDSALRLGELSSLYISQHNYNKLIDFLKRLEKTKASVCDLPYPYYIAFSRYEQLKYLEETQNWQEYFDSGNSYRQELYSETEKFVNKCPLSSFCVRAQGINWLIHKSQNDSQAEESLSKLMDMVGKYAESIDSQGINVIKEVADYLSEEGEAAKAKAVYNLYANRLIAIEISPDKLLSYAKDALSAGNIALSEIIYNRYIEIIIGTYPKDKGARELKYIIKEFVNTGWEDGRDPLFSESVFQKLKEFGGKDYFDADTQYLRAYNLQCLKDYLRCIEEYELLIKDFPDSAYVDEAVFKLGILYTYMVGRSDKGLSYFDKIIERNKKEEYVVESLYHKGLINQYKKDFENANSNYSKILDLIGSTSDFQDLVTRVEMRQKEIKESKEIEYNLKAFLDSSLEKNGYSAAIDIAARPLKSVKGDTIRFSVIHGPSQTGCMSEELADLWSGSLGNITPTPVGEEFTTEYKTLGTKVVNLVVMSPDGVTGGVLEFVDIYSKKD